MGESLPNSDYLLPNISWGMLGSNGLKDGPYGVSTHTCGQKKQGRGITQPIACLFGHPCKGDFHPHFPTLFFFPGDVQGGPHQRGSLSGAGTPGTASPLSSDWVFRSVLVLMISLLCANSLLFYKMWFLETRLRWVGMLHQSMYCVARWDVAQETERN